MNDFTKDAKHAGDASDMSDANDVSDASDASDAIVIYDRSSRRRFIRTGAAFLLAGGAVARSSQTLAGDCDRAPDENNPKQAGNGSDSDAGANADPEGCGRRQDKPKITRLRDTPESTQQVAKSVELVTISG